MQPFLLIWKSSELKKGAKKLLNLEANTVAPAPVVPINNTTQYANRKETDKETALWILQNFIDAENCNCYTFYDRFGSKIYFLISFLD